MSEHRTMNINLNFLGILTIVFVVMKCMGYINWSWWLVFSPILVSIAFSILVLFVIFTK